MSLLIRCDHRHVLFKVRADVSHVRYEQVVCGQVVYGVVCKISRAGNHR